MTQQAYAATKDVPAHAGGRHRNYHWRRDDGRLRPRGLEMKNVRKRRGLTQEHLAHRSGVTLKTIRNIENNAAYRCTMLTITTLASCLKVEPHTLIELDGNAKVKILASAREILDTNMHIAASARRSLICIGSRSRDPEYLRRIETTLEEQPGLIHYRVMALPPFKQVFQEHLLRMLRLRDPNCRKYGHKTLHIGIYDALLKQSEFSLCANEMAVLIVLPSMFGVGEYNTALLIEDAAIAEKYAVQAKVYYQMGRQLETEHDIHQQGLVKEGERYV